MSMHSPAYSKTMLLTALGFLLLATSGCAYYYYNYYCKVLGYYLPGCIKPPSEELALLPPVPIPADNPQSPQKVELGKMLFFDPILSEEGTVSCASCHLASAGFSDPRQVSLGIKRKQGNRNAPTVLSAAYNRHQFWDGRAPESSPGKRDSLEQQALMPIENDREMGQKGNLKEAVDRLNKIEKYRNLFNDAFGSPEAKDDRIAKAIAAFERTLIATHSPFDRWIQGESLSADAIRGWKVFSDKNCQNCHLPPLYSDQNFHNIGVTHRDPNNPDPGRAGHTNQPADRCKFKTPTLRNLALTAPYMHTGKLESLEEVIRFYNRGGDVDPCKTKDTERITPLNLSNNEQKYLLDFLKSLTGWMLWILPPALPEFEYPPTGTAQKGQ